MRARHPTIRVPPGGGWEDGLARGLDPQAEAALLERLPALRWFRGKARRLAAARIADVVPVQDGEVTGAFLFIAVAYREGDPELYVLPLVRGGEEPAGTEEAGAPLFEIEDPEGRKLGVLRDGMADPRFQALLLAGLARQERWPGTASEVSGALAGDAGGLGLESGPPPAAVKGEQSNTSIVYGETAILKLYRRLEPGTSPDLEMGRYLGAHGFRNTPRVLGVFDWRRRGEAFTLGILNEYVPHAVDGWRHALSALDGYLASALALGTDPAPPPPALLGESTPEPPPVRAALGSYPAVVALLGQRTAELHAALAAGAGVPGFAPEPYTPAAQRAFHDSLRDLVRRVFELLGSRLRDLPGAARAEARAALAAEDAVDRRFQALLAMPLASLRMRTHGDYHLGQVLFTGKDFVILDFEGEPTRPLAERRARQSPLRDAAGMLRSFAYAAAAGLRERTASPEERTRLEPWARFWSAAVSRRFLASYLAGLAGGPAFAWTAAELQLLLEVHLLEKAVYEIDYELNNRPDWVRIPLQGLLDLLAAGRESGA